MPPSASESSNALRSIEFVPTNAIEKYYASIGLTDAESKRLVGELKGLDTLKSIKAIDEGKLKPPPPPKPKKKAAAPKPPPASTTTSMDLGDVVIGKVRSGEEQGGDELSWHVKEI